MRKFLGWFENESPVGLATVVPVLVGAVMLGLFVWRVIENGGDVGEAQSWVLGVIASAIAVAVLIVRNAKHFGTTFIDGVQDGGAVADGSSRDGEEDAVAIDHGALER